MENSHVNLWNAYQNIIRTKGSELAVHAKDGTLTFNDIDLFSSSLAESILLKEKNVQEVVVLIDRSKHILSSILASFKLGIPYVPLDINWPLNRVKYILEQLTAPVFITNQNLQIEQVELLQQMKIPKIELADLVLNRSSVYDYNTSWNPSYLLFTSGSTGNPKGVKINSKNILHFINGLKEDVISKYFDFPLDIHMALLSPHVFDASFQNVFLSVFFGGELYIMDEYIRQDGNLIVDYFMEHSIHLSDGTPFHLSLLEEKLNLEELSLSCMLIGGEKMLPEQINGVLKDNKRSLAIVNVYGPTECTVDATFCIIEKEIKAKEVSIGIPLKGTKIKILNQNLTAVFEENKGELWIGGNGVAEGYPFDEKKTKEMFVSFQGEGVYYKTGDIVSQKKGSLYYHGRLDSQIKIQGNRIEVGEIESILSMHSAVKECKLIFDEEEIVLVAFVVLNQVCEHTDLFNFLSLKLPQYMLPHQIKILQAFPRTSVGKIDLLELKTLIIQKEAEKLVEAPHLETGLKKIWEDVLGENLKVKKGSHFFKIGGKSLTAMKLVKSIKTKFGVKVTIVDVFKNPYFEKQIELIEDKLSVEEAK